MNSEKWNVRGYALFPVSSTCMGNFQTGIFIISFNYVYTVLIRNVYWHLFTVFHYWSGLCSLFIASSAVQIPASLTVWSVKTNKRRRNVKCMYSVISLKSDLWVVTYLLSTRARQGLGLMMMLWSRPTSNLFLLVVEILVLPQACLRRWRNRGAHWSSLDSPRMWPRWSTTPVWIKHDITLQHL